MKTVTVRIPVAVEEGKVFNGGRNDPWNGINRPPPPRGSNPVPIPEPVEVEGRVGE